MDIQIFDKIYDIRKNGCMILVKESSSFAKLLASAINKHQRIKCFDDPLKYLDHYLYEVLLSDNQNKADIQYALFLVLNDNYECFQCVKGAVSIENRCIEIDIDAALLEMEKAELIQNIFQGTTLQELGQSYMNNNNYLIDLKNFMFPYDQSVLDKIAISSFKNLEEQYKKVARLMFLYRAEAVNKLAEIRKNFPKVQDKPNNLLSLNATLANIKDKCANIKENAYNGFDCCMDSFMEEVENNIEGLENEYYRSIWDDAILNRYFRLFLEQNFYKQLNERIRIKPDRNLYEIHMGKNWNSQNGENNIKTLYITPRGSASTGKWENDKSEIRRVPFQYYSIGHFLYTGIVESKSGQRVCNQVQVEEFYKMPELVADEKAFVECYLQYLSTLEMEEYLHTPLLIPQFRYGGNDLDYRYRSDFVILNYRNNRNIKKYMIELSRENTHKELGAEDAMRRNEFIKKYSFLTLEFRDTELNKMAELFQKEIVGLLK